jgi:hypothetical protein
LISGFTNGKKMKRTNNTCKKTYLEQVDIITKTMGK